MLLYTSMKPAFVIAFICAVVAISAYYYNKRVSTEVTEIDLIKNSLSGTRAFIHSGSSIAFTCPKNAYQLLSITRFVLAPSFIVERKNDADTLLSVQYSKAQDTSITAIINSRNTIWHTEDSLYTYNLSIAR